MKPRVQFLISMAALATAVTAKWAVPDLHQHMNEVEMEHFFGTSDAGGVDLDYEVISIRDEIKRADSKANDVIVEKRSGDSVNASSGKMGLNYAFDAFGNHFDLKLEKNDVILPPLHTVGDGGGGRRQNCQFIHKAEEMTAAFASCEKSGVNGMVFTKESAYDVRQLGKSLRQRAFRLMNKTSGDGTGGDDDDDDKKLFLVKRIDMAEVKKRLYEPNHGFKFSPVDKRNLQRLAKRGGSSGLYLETAVFVDQLAYRRLARYYGDDRRQVEDFIMLYMNGVQAIFHLESLRNMVEISVRKLAIIEHGTPWGYRGGERQELYNQFCAYQEGENVKDDSDPGHWDIALLVSGIDFYSGSGRSMYVTMGLAAVGTVCTGKWACVIGELGTTAASSGKTYPSTGLTAVYVMAHEIGHNLGMHHDKGSCNRKHIMASSRGLVGKNSWSPCSRSEFRPTDFTCLQDPPGRTDWPLDPDHPNDPWMPGEICEADCQCQMFYLDKQARSAHTNANLEEICETVLCKSESKPGGVFRVGPALEGTKCGEGRWCHDGECVRAQFHQATGGSHVSAASKGRGPYFGKWVDGQCKSECLLGSKGFKIRSRDCLEDNPRKGTILSTGCKGPQKAWELCDDYDICRGRRKTMPEYATEICEEVKGKFDIDGIGSTGVQGNHDEKDISAACRIYCNKASGRGYYSPLAEVSNSVYSRDFSYFPDGTYCHQNKGGKDHYCLNQQCVPEGDRIARSGGVSHDTNINLISGASEIPDSVMEYLSLNEDKQRQGGSPIVGDAEIKKAEEQEEIDDSDYIEIP